jgi:hypothetical protein
MNDHRALAGNADLVLESMVAELTAAAYPVALRHGGGDKWLDLELDLWRTLRETVRRSGRKLLQPS